MPIDNLSHYVRVYDHGLEEGLCRRMIESFAGLSRFQRPNGRGIRAGLEESAWTELNVTAPSAIRHFCGTPVRKRFRTGSRSIPMTPSRGPTMPASEQ